jgi:hypothetical protein
MRSRRSDHKRRPRLHPFWTAFRSPRCGDGFRSCGDLEQGLDVGFGGFFDSVRKKQSGAMQRQIWRGGLRGERGRRCTGSEPPSGFFSLLAKYNFLVFFWNILIFQNMVS